MVNSSNIWCLFCYIDKHLLKANVIKIICIFECSLKYVLKFGENINSFKSYDSFFRIYSKIQQFLTPSIITSQT